MIECRLAIAEDNTPETIGKIFSMAEDYYRKSQDDAISPMDVVEVFQGFTARNTDNPQFWMVLSDKKSVGFMLTVAINYNGRVGLQITQGYLEKQFAGKRISHECMRAVEDLAKQNDLKFVSCITRLDAGVYGRWLRPAGYKREYTAFMKEF